MCNNSNASSVNIPVTDAGGCFFNEGMFKRQSLVRRATNISGSGHHLILGADANINDLYRNAGKDYIENT